MALDCDVSDRSERGEHTLAKAVVRAMAAAVKRR